MAFIIIIIIICGGGGLVFFFGLVGGVGGVSNPQLRKNISHI